MIQIVMIDKNLRIDALATECFEIFFTHTPGRQHIFFINENLDNELRAKRHTVKNTISYSVKYQTYELTTDLFLRTHSFLETGKLCTVEN